MKLVYAYLEVHNWLMDIQNIFVKHQNTIYEAPKFDIWISIIQLMEIRNCELRCSINAPDLWATKLTYATSHLRLWSFINQMWSFINNL